MQQQLTSLPIAFEPNVGQASAAARYLAHGHNYRLELTDAGSDLEFANATHHRSVLHMKLDGADPHPELVGRDLLASKTNDLDRNRSHEDMANCAQVTYRNVYPGVDLLYYGHRGQLEYDFVVAPGADPAQIHLNFPGSRNLRLDPASGDLLITTADGALVHHGHPSLYQGAGSHRSQVVGQYHLINANTVAFSVAHYDVSRQLIIDPTIFADNLEGNSSQFVYAVTYDAAGNSYVLGITDSTVGFARSRRG